MRTMLSMPWQFGRKIRQSMRLRTRAKVKMSDRYIMNKSKIQQEQSLKEQSLKKSLLLTSSYTTNFITSHYFYQIMNLSINWSNHRGTSGLIIQSLPKTQTLTIVLGIKHSMYKLLVDISYLNQTTTLSILSYAQWWLTYILWWNTTNPWSIFKSGSFCCG